MSATPTTRSMATATTIRAADPSVRGKKKRASRGGSGPDGNGDDHDGDDHDPSRVDGRDDDGAAGAGDPIGSLDTLSMRLRAIRTALLRWPIDIPIRRQLISGIASALSLGVLTAVFANNPAPQTLVFVLFLFVVVGAASSGGRLVALITAVAAHILLNVAIDDRPAIIDLTRAELVVELVIFLVIATFIAALDETATRRRNVIRKRTEEAAQLAATNQLRTALLRAVSHDLRTPLASAKLATSSLLAGHQNLSDDARSQLVEIADTNLDRLERIIGNLLEAGRLEAGVISPQLDDVDIIEVVGRVLTSLPDEKVDRVGFRLDHSATMMRADAALAERVLVNLVSNALNADPTGAIVIATRRDAGWVAVDVIDHGPGIPADKRANALRPFHRFEDTGSATGIGLGLAICSGFSHAMGAQLLLTETRGGGLTATLRAPAPATEREESANGTTECASIVP